MSSFDIVNFVSDAMTNDQLQGSGVNKFVNMQLILIKLYRHGQWMIYGSTNEIPPLEELEIGLHQIATQVHVLKQRVASITSAKLCTLLENDCRYLLTAGSLTVQKSAIDAIFELVEELLVLRICMLPFSGNWDAHNASQRSNILYDEVRRDLSYLSLDIRELYQNAIEESRLSPSKLAETWNQWQFKTDLQANLQDPNEPLFKGIAEDVRAFENLFVKRNEQA